MSRTRNTLPDAAEIDVVIAASKYLPPDDAADSRLAAADAAAAADAPPRLTGGEQETQKPSAGEQIDWANIQTTEYFQTYVTDAKGNLLEIPLRKGREDGALIDYLTFTFHEDTIFHYLQNRLVGQNDFISACSESLEKIFGFGITKKMLGKGKFFYQAYYQIGPDNAAYGTLHHGGQRNTVLIDLNAVGCQAALPGWEGRLYEFLQQAIKPRITRCDVAHDFFNGEYTPDQALVDHKKGRYDNHNVTPKAECRGTAWNIEDGSGKTLYIGRKGSSKLARIYEKGKKFGDKSSPWVRFEVEFRKHDCVIPHDILIKPGQYLTGAFPIGEELFQVAANRIETKANVVNLTFEQREFHARNQVGRFVRFLVDAGFPDSEIVRRLVADEGKYPKGLDPSEYNCDAIRVHYLHHDGFAPFDLDEFRMTIDEYMPTDAECHALYEEIEARKRLQQAGHIAESLIRKQEYPTYIPEPEIVSLERNPS
ncbi:replication initiation factor domain-containing protein [Neisseria shayeganii]|uniref:Replication initiation factor n=1 Tax=Neisseria shayeganii 871 TaxID=1032488 RepID=G4CLK2_9NEIS|nr:replication initiation factor domain-containing protein [Neisseria shayeganii]EGY51321.1 replication initiation factor [Neisseria shayeganii 871]